MFKLDNRIEQDSFLVKEFNDFQIRIMDVREVFWVILIPTKINLIELSDLDIEKRNILINFAVELGDYLKSKGRYYKTNIGMLGNVVSQLHLHLVLRKKVTQLGLVLFGDTTLKTNLMKNLNQIDQI